MKSDIEILHPYDEFLKEKRIDLTDYEYAGTFPMFSEKLQRWTVISRGKAWQLYSQWLQDKYATLRSQMQGRAQELAEKNLTEYNKLYKDYYDLGYKLDAEIKSYKATIKQMQGRIDELEPYIHHHGGCAKNLSAGEQSCSCGLDQILKTV